MNGRMYDPLLGRFLSPDPFVQLPDFSQNFNRYSYCLNNPLVYVDPDGEFIFGYTLGFIRGLFSKNPLNAFKEGFKGGMNELKIYGGLFTGNAGQIASRFTWELPQTILGVTWSLTRNALGKVDQVEYFDGATFVINENTSKSNGVTLAVISILTIAKVCLKMTMDVLHLHMTIYICMNMGIIYKVRIMAGGICLV